MSINCKDKRSEGQVSIPVTDRVLSEIDIATLPRDVFFGNVMYDAGGTYGPRIQEHLQIVIISSGEAIVTVDGDGLRLEQGEVALLKQGHEEFFEFTKTAKTYHSWCHFHWDLPENIVHLIEALPFKTEVSNRMERLIDLGLSLQHDPQALHPSLSHLAAASFWEYVSSVGLAAFSSQNARLPRTCQARASLYTPELLQRRRFRAVERDSLCNARALNSPFSQTLGHNPHALPERDQAASGGFLFEPHGYYG